jgi:sulfotransferase
VRNPAWVMDSVERLVRKNAFDVSRIFNSAQERSTVYTRAGGRGNAVSMASRRT